MSPLDRIVILICKVIHQIIVVGKLGNGATWPGEIALKLRPQILSAFARLPVKVVVIAGTNGKTTTTKMLETIMEASGEKTKRNATGANLENGVVSAFIDDFSYSGTLHSKTFLFEVDEAAFIAVTKKLVPSIVVLLNLFRDQLDRYGEVDAIAQKWLPVLRQLPKTTTVIANADDPQLVVLTEQLAARVLYFGLEEPSLYLSKIEHATDTIYCPKCGQRLTFAGVYFSHLGKWTCGKCGLIHPEVTLKASDYASPIEGVYNKYNTLAASLVCEFLRIPSETIVKGLTMFTPAFGRMETVIYKDKTMTILLSKNPTGFNESLRTVLSSSIVGPIVLVLNDRIPDGTDISWIWDVDFEMLHSYKHPLFVGGDRTYDMGIRVEYSIKDALKNKSHSITVSENLPLLLEKAASEVKDGEKLWVLATYSAMLDVRKIATGKKIL